MQENHSDLHLRLTEAASAIGGLTGRSHHDMVAVLGSGLGGYPDQIEGAIKVPYDRIPGFPEPSAPGHSGAAYSVEMGRNRVLLYSGRVHHYEGYSPDQIVFSIRAAILSGARCVVLTNASGGCRSDIAPGDLVLLTDHINPTGLSPLRGPNDDRLGTRFPDMTDVYSPWLRQQAREAADQVGVGLREGVYMWWRGPMFETPAEIRMAITLGADLIGMSTVPEAIAARHMGAEVLGISLCTNRAAGLAAGRITGEEVIEVAGQAAGRLRRLFDALLPRLEACPPKA
ncbi:MAG: purine-nucleoside phosphorylase [Acidimicrobiia bacterium]|nr:purine-nucleoside phosphorylase [Acidimicrobiia bacterium]MYF26476.1 purine-nucleoside phosphorylase [Acidimicrobiia bacterium]